MDISARVMRSTRGWLEKRCYWCGQYFKQDEQIVLIVPKYEYKVKYEKLGKNVVMHNTEYEELSKSCQGVSEAILEKLGTHTKKRPKEVISEAQKIECEAFKKACRNMGFNIETNTTDEIHMRKSRTSLTLIYRPRGNTISLRKRGNTGIMDRMFMRQIEAEVFNGMHAILGDNAKDKFTAQGIINKAITDINKIMGTDK